MDKEWSGFGEPIIRATTMETWRGKDGIEGIVRNLAKSNCDYKFVKNTSFTEEELDFFITECKAQNVKNFTGFICCTFEKLDIEMLKELEENERRADNT